MANYYVELVEVYDKVDTADYSDTSFSSELDTAQPKKDKRKLTDLKKEIQSYAISQKAYKRKTIKSDKKSWEIENLSEPKVEGSQIGKISSVATLWSVPK